MKNKTDDGHAERLVSRREELIMQLTAEKGTSIDHQLNELLEIERLLTLMED